MAMVTELELDWRLALDCWGKVMAQDLMRQDLRSRQSLAELP